MPHLPINITVSRSPADHLADHIALHQMQGQIQGPFALAWNTSGINTGVALWTPHVDDRIMGLWVELDEEFDVEDEQMGLGIVGATDADLAYIFDVTTPPVASPSWVRGAGLGYPLGTSVTRLLTETPIVARAVIGGNTQGSLTMWVATLPASMF